MTAARADLAALFKRLHGMGIEAAQRHWPNCNKSERSCHEYGCSNSLLKLTQCDVLQVLGEMMTTDTGDITMGDVLTAAKRADVF